MNYSRMNGVEIVGMASAVSNNWQSLEDLCKGTEDEQIVVKFSKKTGVVGRYNAGVRQTTSDFCFAAAEKILIDKKIDKSEIGILVFVTQTPDYGIPATACVLQDRLGLPKECIAFDVNLGCSGFTYGITIVSSLLQTTSCKYALLLCGDTSAKEMNASKKVKTTHSASWLFGDSGSATLFMKSSEAKNISCSSATDGSGFKAIISPYKLWRNPRVPDGQAKGTRMDDVAVFNFATSDVVEQINNMMEKEGTSPDDYDCLVLHQANLFIMKQIGKKTGFSTDKNLVAIDEFGNTSSASIPNTLVKQYGDSDDSTQLHILACGFGVGLSWSTVDFYLNKEAILPLIHTDDYYLDGYSD